MSARMTNPATILPQSLKGVGSLLGALEDSGLPLVLRELISLRVSQINGCAACVYGHVDTLRKEGESEDRVNTVVVWRESPFFTDSERAALNLAEAATRLADSRATAVPDEIWDDAADHFDEKALAGVVLQIALINFFNRINVTIQEPAGTTWS